MDDVVDVVIQGQPRQIRGEILVRDAKRPIWTASGLDWDVPRRLSMLQNPNNSTLNVYVNGISVVDPASGFNIQSVERESGSDWILFKDAEGRTQVRVDPEAGTVWFAKTPPLDTIVSVVYTPRTLRLTSDLGADTAPVAFIDRYAPPPTPNGIDPLTGLSDRQADTGHGRLWIFWRKESTELGGRKVSTLFYKTFRLGVRLPTPVGLQMQDNGAPQLQIAVTANGKPVPFFVDIGTIAGVNPRVGRVFVTEAFEGLTLTVNYTDPAGGPHTVNARAKWFEEQGDTQLLPADTVVDEGQIAAFKDPLFNPQGYYNANTRDQVMNFNKVWVFWTSTRAGTTDLYYQTVSPKFNQ